MSDDAEADGAAQPADDGEPVYKVATIANEGEAQGLQKDADDYTLLTSDDDLTIYLAMQQNKPEKLRLAADISSSTPINISQNTTIDLAGHKLCYPNGNGGSFITVTSGALTIEDSAKTLNDEPTTVNENNPGQLATVERDGNNKGIPKSLTYFVTTSEPKADGPGTTETTTKHVVSGFGAIVGASEGGSVQHVISVEDGGMLNLNGGMITTPRTLGNNGHVIFSRGAVNISGGYVTNGNGGGWGGGLCVTGANAKFNMTGGVIAANKAASGGGIYADNGAKLNLSGGVISGNATYRESYDSLYSPDNGYGGGVFTKNADVTIGGSANITNNRVDSYITNWLNNGLLGGGGIASVNGGKLTMTGGSVTANYSHEAGGGVYAGFWNQAITFKMTGGTIAGNKSDNAEGGGLRISQNTTGFIEATGASSKVYITNNKTMTGSTTGRGGDWGGGGVFVQTNGTLNLRAALVTNNEAGGWGGGIGACPTGKTIVTHTNGSAIYGNTDHGENFSAGGNGKNEDSQPNYITDDFKNSGHKDFFLVRNKDGANQTIAVVLGKMLGNGSAGWKGTCDGQKITIDPNGGAEAKYMFGLEAHPSEQAINDAKTAATTIISGNYSYTHGGGIMTNGDLIVGEVEALNVYPAIKVKANKVLMKDDEPQSLSGHGYQFKLLGKAVGSGGEPYWNTDGTLNANGCEATPEVTVNDKGEIVIDTAANFQSGNYDLYLVEVPINEEGTKFDKAIYKIHVSVSANPVTTTLMGININRYVVDAKASEVFVNKGDGKGFTPCGFYNWNVDPADSAVSIVTIGNDSSPAFKNELAPYQASGTWTPQVTKNVDGGEMKEFKFELFTKDSNGEKTSLQTKSTSAGARNSQTVTFDPVKIGPLGIKDLTDGKTTFTYYIRECDASDTDGIKHEGYTNDTKTFKVVVTAEDNKNGTLTCTPAYYEVDASGHESPNPTDAPTFTNTYSTSLPLSGMSGVTLTYLAGAAVLCAAAAWMHIRRKANAKGGERRE